MAPVRHIGVFVDLIGSYGRGVFLGIQKYCEEVGNWHCTIPWTWPLGARIELEKWKVDGWISQSGEGSIGRQVERYGKPLIAVSTSDAQRGRPAVIGDNAAVGRMAFDYLLNRGHSEFTFIGHSSAAFSRERQASFMKAVREYGKPYHPAPDYDYTSRSRREIGRWLTRAPKPLAVLCDNDSVGAHVLDVCRDFGLAVPQAVAVLSVDNDELMCTARLPTLSSIQLDTRRIGYEASALLDRVLNGEPVPPKPLLIPPLRVVTRQSTDTLAFADQEVHRAVQYIREHIAEPTTVADVQRHATVSARPLQIRFRRQLQCSILTYIHRQHVERAMSLLAGTDLSISRVAAASGFSSPTRLGIIFHRLTNQTPSQYRRKSRDS